MTTIKITIERAALGERGLRYRATYLGSILVESSRNLEFDACRALLARGITGKLQVWRAGTASADMCLDIERGAGLTIHETDASGPRLARWKPRPDDDAQTASVSCAVSSGTANRELVTILP